MGIECRGCNMYKIELNKCGVEVLPHISETEHCPCLTCLLKGICQNTCKEYDVYLMLSDDRKYVMSNMRWPDEE